MQIEGLNINYLDYGNKKGAKTIVLLHGWGQNIEMMDMLGKPFEKNYRIINVDLPGFGKSDEPKEVINVGDYTSIIEKLLKELNVYKPILIGHSFGGRICIKFAARNDVEKLILLSAPLRGHDRKGLKTKILKSLKQVPGLNKLESWAKNHIGSRDYKAASPVMKQVLVQTVNEDLSSDLTKIGVPTIIIYGDLDSEVPYGDIKVMESLLNDCGLVLYEGCTHYAYLERLNQTIGIISNFIK